MRIILAGCIGRFPLAGHAWITSQYLLGLRSLGHDVYYLEDSGEESWVYEWSREEMTNDINYPANFIARMLDPIGMEGRWIYRTSHHSAGMSLDELREHLPRSRFASHPWSPDQCLARRVQRSRYVAPLLTLIRSSLRSKQHKEIRISLRRSIDASTYSLSRSGLGKPIAPSRC